MLTQKNTLFVIPINWRSDNESSMMVYAKIG